ncbi:LysR family transcriptional regulator [Roseospira marina]|uniref:LysR family transcriptional regulator n=1 Tax=Roseospira marina TaxID=140057 RepID=A0A5M6I8S1_9PROT|nr:LysR family transcriptional regulator [Roseospira marina]KAA5604098.1 LysR family transcriptional regulator [Roseospira marina]MBB4315803.1 DNA-binding transcriptional LysR family regulator [Roseospira marina]MBB5088958.1 DNA-binding transcriptional LysR family regulator [Roseospira marina]
MIPDIPSPLLRSFTAVVDCGSLSAAAVRVGRSDSALSLQMARLEDIVGTPLFDRDGRALKLNQTGAQLLPHARAILGRIDAAREDLGRARGEPIRIGIVQDLVDSVLRPSLAALGVDVTGQAISLVIGSTAELLQALSEERIDTAVHAGDAVHAVSTRVLPVRWFGDPARAEAEVVPLLGITPPCPFLTAAQHGLDAVGRPWRMVLSTPSLDGLRAAVQAGLGVTGRTDIGLGGPPLPAGALPPLPDIHYSVVERRWRKGAPSATARTLARCLDGIAADR